MTFQFCIDGRGFNPIGICLLQLKVGDRTEKVRYFHCYKRGVDRVFVDHPLFLAKVGIFLNLSVILFCFQIFITSD